MGWEFSRRLPEQIGLAFSAQENRIRRALKSPGALSGNPFRTGADSRVDRFQRFSDPKGVMQVSREQELQQIIQTTPWFMSALGATRELNLTSWCIGAGAIRNLDWDRLC